MKLKISKTIHGWRGPLRCKLRITWLRIKAWWLDNRPVMCSQCRSIVRQKEVEYERHSVAGWVPICKKCWDELFTPFNSLKK